jgi:hypothetical protein
MLRLIRAYSRGEYRAVPQSALLSIIAAINYLVEPFDLIPDDVPFLGLLTTLPSSSSPCVNTRRSDDFMAWETITF